MHKIQKPTRRRSVLAYICSQRTLRNLIGQAVNKTNLRKKELKTTVTEQRLINKMTNWQRQQWAKPTVKKGKKVKGCRPERIKYFLDLQRSQHERH